MDVVSSQQKLRKYGDLTMRLGYYLKVFGQMAKLALATILEYRVDAVVRSFYMFAYISGTLLLINTVFTQTNFLGGFDYNEIMLMYASMMVMWALMETFFFDGFKYFVLYDIRNGDFDKTLIKPVNPLFLLSISKFRIESALIGVVMMCVFLYYASLNLSSITFVSAVIYLGFFILGIYIHYRVFTCYASLAFFMTKASQALRTLQSASDQCFYPTIIYPWPVGLVFFTLLPIALAAYVPVSFLLNRGSFLLLGGTLLVAIGSTLLSSYLWKMGLQQYSSASS
ncbi:MAG TPA: ABC-2 family transporter protein [Patescibacteria group bacterium]